MSGSADINRDPPPRSSIRRIIELSNHDFCPWVNRYVYWLKQPIGWFMVAAAASLLIAVFLAPHAWVIFGSLVAVMALGVVWPWVAMRGITAEIAFDRRRCREDERTRVRLIVQNRWPWPCWGLAVEKGFFFEAADAMVQPVTALARVSGWSKSEFVFDFCPAWRGVYPYAAPEIVTGFPFGLWAVHREISVLRPLLAWQRTTPLTSVPSLGGEIADVIGMLFDRPGQEGDTIGVRPFRQGDRLRSIHWAQTARRDSFIVTERQSTARRLVVLVVDHTAFALGSADLMETAIRVSASVAQQFHAHHAQVRFVMGALDLILEPGSAGLHRLLDDLARFRPQQESGHRRKELPRDAMVLVVTTSDQKTAWDSAARTGGQFRYVFIDQATSLSGEAGLRTGGGRQTWIRLDGSEEAPLQLRRQWERICRDSIAN